MADNLNITLKGEQRDGEEVFIIETDRDGEIEILDKTRSELILLLERETLRVRRFQALFEEARFDKQPLTAIAKSVQQRTRKEVAIRGILNFLDSNPGEP